jgi:hypothetical protein
VAALATLTALARTLLAGATTAAMQGTLGLGTAATQTYTEGTFTATGTGFTAGVTATAQYVRVGKLATLRLPDLSGTSNATTMTVTGLPAAMSPTAVIRQPVVIQNNGAYALGMMQITGTTIDVFSTGGFTGFVATGAKALISTAIAYPLA